ncbi:Aste57867_25343 [Aphanomyces stellatus]|uniref:Aste57867_25343 protein n=1 Tax=Aphanomyces stellatus TaxID=120398 RepID=A0A485LTK2_9STRA|nr:hypothetical protein As57867_025265 [Aphanomyces stellatus]VFU01968.1 Aste57867_25343 [Aphanomyces stellatus]
MNTPTNMMAHNMQQKLTALPRPALSPVNHTMLSSSLPNFRRFLAVSTPTPKATPTHHTATPRMMMMASPDAAFNPFLTLHSTPKNSSMLEPSPCAVDGCDKFAKMHHYCLAHFRAAASAMTPVVRRGATPISPACSSISDRPKYANRRCKHLGCSKYGLAGGFCISHGGGKKCLDDGCDTTAQSGGYCKSHGGGSRCRFENCHRIAKRKGVCKEHGGRHLCKVDGCGKCAHKSGLCVGHGGGRKCSVDGCTKTAQGKGVCYTHGGGKRCSLDGCSHAARRGGFCITHTAKSA